MGRPRIPRNWLPDHNDHIFGNSEQSPRTFCLFVSGAKHVPLFSRFSDLRTMTAPRCPAHIMLNLTPAPVLDLPLPWRWSEVGDASHLGSLDQLATPFTFLERKQRPGALDHSDQSYWLSPPGIVLLCVKFELPPPGLNLSQALLSSPYPGCWSPLPGFWSFFPKCWILPSLGLLGLCLVAGAVSSGAHL